jgi:hypothetical protein
MENQLHDVSCKDHCRGCRGGRTGIRDYAAASAATQTAAGGTWLKQGSPAAIAAAKEFLAMKNANGIYANAVPTIIAQTRDQLLQANLQYQKDLNEVAVIIARNLAGREKEIGDAWANIYTNEFSEQELKDLVAFYKSALGQKLLAAEPRAMQFCMAYMNQWAQVFSETVIEQFRTEMKKRGKDI